jgi:hypothetical protein
VLRQKRKSFKSEIKLKKQKEQEEQFRQFQNQNQFMPRFGGQQFVNSQEQPAKPNLNLINYRRDQQQQPQQMYPAQFAPQFMGHQELPAKPNLNLINYRRDQQQQPHIHPSQFAMMGFGNNNQQFEMNPFMQASQYGFQDPSFMSQFRHNGMNQFQQQAPLTPAQLYEQLKNRQMIESMINADGNKFKNFDSIPSGPATRSSFSNNDRSNNNDNERRNNRMKTNERSRGNDNIENIEKERKASQQLDQTDKKNKYQQNLVVFIDKNKDKLSTTSKQKTDENEEKNLDFKPGKTF